MFSCRVQAKRVEHHFIAHLARVAADAGAATLRARYVKSDRNAVSGRVFDELGFVVVKRTNNVRELEMKLDDVHFDQCVIEIRELAGGAHVG